MPDDQLAKQLMRHKGAGSGSERVKAYRASLARALALLNDGRPNR
jgi:hypothetical protein